MMSCHSQASLPSPVGVDPSRCEACDIPTSLPSIDDEHMEPSPNLGLISMAVAPMVTRTPIEDVLPHCYTQAIQSPCTAPSPTGGDDEETQEAHSTPPPLEPLAMDSVQPSSPVMEVAPENEEAPKIEEAATPAVEEAQTKQHQDAGASTSVVNVIPLDSSNPEATINAPQAVRRYLTRWPQGDKPPHPVFTNTEMHEFRTMHNNQDESRRREELAKVVPRHVNVSFLQLSLH